MHKYIDRQIGYIDKDIQVLRQIYVCILYSICTYIDRQIDIERVTKGRDASRISSTTTAIINTTTKRWWGGMGGDIRVGEDDSQADTHNGKGKAEKGR